jgi:hypothetical protein
MTDPFAILGLPRTASAAEVRAARRQWSKRLHPDALVSAGDNERRAAAAKLAEVNRAVDLALATLKTPTPDVHHTPAAPTPPPTQADSRVDDGTAASFGIDASLVEAFELLLLGMSAIGDPKVVDEPYMLEGMVDDPALCLCRIHLAPKAEATIVTVVVHPMARSRVPTPSALEVAGRLVAEIQALGLE